MVDNDVLLRRIINLNDHFTTIMEQMVCLQLVSVAFLSPLCIHEKQKYNGRNILTSILTFYKVWDFINKGYQKYMYFYFSQIIFYYLIS